MVREMFHDSAVYAALADKVHADHIDRLDGPEAEKLVPRPYKRRPRPNTAIIALAAQRVIENRGRWSELASKAWKPKERV